MIFILFIPSLVFATVTVNPQFHWTQRYHYDLRQKNHQLYVNRLSLNLNYSDKDNKGLFSITPFFEIRRNIDKDLWERKELGVEIGKEIFPWLYLGNAIQKGWQKEDYRFYADYEKRDYMESEMRLMLKHKLLSTKYVTLNGFILNEYTYDFDIGASTRNEVAIGLTAPVGKYAEAEINWRHIDRIHYYDSDTFEAAITLIF